MGEKIEPILSEHITTEITLKVLIRTTGFHRFVLLIMASSVRDFLIELDPEGREKYEENFKTISEKINGVDLKARELSVPGGKKSFMIYHPNLAYLARDYGLEEISVEYEGKEPTPSRIEGA